VRLLHWIDSFGSHTLRSISTSLPRSPEELALLEMWTYHRIRSVVAFAAPLLFTREQPQETSHDKYLRKVNEMLWINNTINVPDPVFGLLVDDSAKKGNGFISDLGCLQMAISDVAYTNSKRTSDVNGMVASLIYRTLERNTIGVGVRSEPCKTMRAVNPEIAVLEQHQDPASSNAANHNRAVVLELARQIHLIGGNVTLATDAGTFAPGVAGDITGKGNTCDDPDCIYKDGRLQKLVSNDEIMAYVSQCVATVTVTSTQPTGTRAASIPASATSISSPFPPNDSNANSQTIAPPGTTGMPPSSAPPSGPH